METFCKQDHYFLSDTYSLSQECSSFEVTASSALIVISRLSSIVFLLFAKEVVQTFWTHPKVFFGIQVALIIYTILITVMVSTNYCLSRFHAFQRKTTRERAKNILCKIVSYLIFPMEYVVYELKAMCLVFLLIDKNLKAQLDSKFGENTSYILLAFSCADFCASVALNYFKIQFLRQEVPDGGYFARIPCTFENFYLVLVPLEKVLSILLNKYALTNQTHLSMLNDQNSVNYTYFTIMLLLLLLALVLYLYEMPYFNYTAERFHAHLLCLALVVHVAIGVSDYSYTMIFKVVCLAFTIQMVFIENYLDCKYEDNINFSTLDAKSTNIIKIKMILTGNIDKLSRNTLKNKLLKRVMNRRRSVLAANESIIYSSILAEREVSLLSTMKKNGVDTREITRAISKHDKSKLKNKEKSSGQRADVNDDIYFLIISRFAEENKDSQLGNILKLDWMLKKKFIILEILNLLNKILVKQDSFKSKYVCFYAFKLVENKLAYFYRMKESNENGYKDLNNVGLDLNTVLNYKKQMVNLSKYVEDFASMLKKTIQMIMTDSSSLRNIYSLETQLYELNHRIQRQYNTLHENTLKTEYFHIIPYFYHLLYSLNLYRTSKKVYQLFVSRQSDVVKNLLEANEMKLDNLSLLHYSTTFLCDSNKNTLSLIRNVYGNKSFKYQSCIDRYPDVILPEVLNTFHYQAMHNYMCSDNTSQMKNVNIGFSKMPNSNLIMKSVIIIKMVPSLKKEFNFMVNLMERQNPEDYYILVNQVLEIDSYSRNLTKLVDKKYLVPGVMISSVSEKSHKFIANMINEAKNFTTDEGLQIDYSEGENRTLVKKTTVDQNYQTTQRTAQAAGEENDKKVFQSKRFGEITKRKDEFSEEIKFGTTKKSAPQTFHIRIVYNHFGYVAGGYFLLRLREVSSQQTGHVKRPVRPRQMMSRADEDNVLNFGDGGLTDIARGVGTIDLDDDEDNFIDESRDSIDNSDMKPNSNLTKPQSVRFSGFGLEDGDPLSSPSKAPFIPRSKTAGKHEMIARKSTIEDKKGEQMTSKNDPSDTKFEIQSKSEKNFDIGLGLKQVTQTSPIHTATKTETTGLKLKKQKLVLKHTRKFQDKKHREQGDNSSSSQENTLHVNKSDAGGSNKNNKQVVKQNQEVQVVGGGSSIYTTDGVMGYKHNKMVYEDICTRKKLPFEILFARGHYLCSSLFVFSFFAVILIVSFDLNYRFTDLNDFYMGFNKFKFLMSQMTNNYLVKFAGDNGKFNNSRYASIGLPLIANLTVINTQLTVATIAYFNVVFQELISVMVKAQKKISDMMFTNRINVSSNFLIQSEVIGQKDDQGLPKVNLEEFSIFEGLIIDSYERILRIQNQNMFEFKPFYLDTSRNVIEKGYYYTAQYFLTYDVFNQHPLNKVEDLFHQAMSTYQKDTMLIMLSVMLAAMVINVLLACIQVLTVRQLGKKIEKVFTAFHLITDKQYSKRLRQLDNVILIIKDLKDYNYMIMDRHKKENFKTIVKDIGRQDTDAGASTSARHINPEDSAVATLDMNRSKRIKYATGNFYFELSIGFFMAIVNSLIILGFILLIYLQFSQKITKKSVLFNKEDQMFSISFDTMNLQNYFLANYLFADPSLLIYQKAAKQGLEAYYSKSMKTWFERINFVFEQNDDNTYSESFIKDFREKDTCSFIPSYMKMYGNMTLCDFGRLGIAKQPLYVALAGLHRHFVDHYSVAMMNSSNFIAYEFNDQRTTEWEFYLAYIFYITVNEFTVQTRNVFLTKYNNSDSSTISFVVISILIFFIAYTVLSIIAMKNLTRQIMVSRFAFQIFSLKAVLDNNKIKSRFVEFFRVNNREFI